MSYFDEVSKGKSTTWVALPQVEASFKYQFSVIVDDQIIRAIPQKCVPERQILR